MKELRILIFESLLIVGAIYSAGYLVTRQPTASYLAAAGLGLAAPLILPKDAYKSE